MRDFSLSYISSVNVKTRFSRDTEFSCIFPLSGPSPRLEGYLRKWHIDVSRNGFLNIGFWKINQILSLGISFQTEIRNYSRRFARDSRTVSPAVSDTKIVARFSLMISIQSACITPRYITYILCSSRNSMYFYTRYVTLFITRTGVHIGMRECI